MANSFRELEVIIGPLKEYEMDGKTDKGGSIKIVSNGNVGTMKVHVSCEKPIVSVANQCIVSIWNLKMATINAIRTAGAGIQVRAGYEGEEKSVLFTGSIRSVRTDRQETDFITRIMAIAGGSSYTRSVTSKTYTAGVNVKDVIKELAEQLPGVAVDPVNINVQGTIGYAGYSLMGCTKDCLDKLAYQFGFSWNVDNGNFMAIQDRSYIGEGILLNSANGLRKVSPRLTGLMQIQEGVDIVAQYIPNVGPGRRIRVVSEVNPQLSRDYTCHTVSYELCPKDESWDMNISCFFVAGKFR